MNDNGLGQDYKSALPTNLPKNKEKEKEKDFSQSKSIPRYHDETDEEDRPINNYNRSDYNTQNYKTYRNDSESYNTNPNNKNSKWSIENPVNERVTTNAMKTSKTAFASSDRSPQTNSIAESSAEQMASDRTPALAKYRQLKKDNKLPAANTAINRNVNNYTNMDYSSD
ncbi:dilute domain-containing protein [Reticulomyxa filosa]|uniref:Dilute domain-containing protein n=1 Tax=Reticulomyxa filosa TaxID=46433 RepID=X6M9S8_RETFI|nr:dilute domain-containing protein [Reticulomyxa filosa]|eukprot:ETO10237.1 dilute domain-containing protein [Reticulomyxa filosa]